MSDLQPAANGQQTNDARSPETETAVSVEACIRDAIESLQGPAYNRVITGARSEAFWGAVEPAKRELVAQVRQDHGGAEDAPVTLLGLMDAYAEASLLRRSLFLRLVDAGGPVTVKGRCRAIFNAWGSAVDREARLAQVLGLERRARQLPQTIAAYVEGKD